MWKWTFHSVVQLKTWEDRNRPRDLGHLHLHNLIMLPFPTYFPIAAAKVIVVKRYVWYTLAPNGPENWKWEFETYLVKFETYLVKFETYSVILDYEKKKTAGAAEPPEPPSLAPMEICQYCFMIVCLQMEYNKKVSITRLHFNSWVSFLTLHCLTFV